MIASKDQLGVIIFGKRERFQYFDVYWPGKDSRPRFIERFIKPFYLSVIRLREGQELVGYYRMLIENQEGLAEKYHVLIHFQYAEDEQGTEERGRPSFLAFAIVISDQFFPTANYVSELYASLKLQSSTFYRNSTYKLSYHILLGDDFSLKSFNADRKLNRSARTANFFNAGAQLDKQISFLYSRSRIETVIGKFYERAVIGEEVLYESNHIYLSTTVLEQLRHDPIDEDLTGSLELVSKPDRTSSLIASDVPTTQLGNVDKKGHEPQDDDDILDGGFGRRSTSKLDAQKHTDSEELTNTEEAVKTDEVFQKTDDEKGVKPKPGQSLEKELLNEKGGSQNPLNKKNQNQIRRGQKTKRSNVNWVSVNNFFKRLGLGIKRRVIKWGLIVIAVLGSLIMAELIVQDLYEKSLLSMIYKGGSSSVYQKGTVEPEGSNEKKNSGQEDKEEKNEFSQNDADTSTGAEEERIEIKDYEGLNFKQLVEKFDSTVNLIKLRPGLNTGSKSVLIQKHAGAVEARYQDLLFSLQTESFTSINRQFIAAMEVKRAIESKDQMKLSSEVVALLKDLEQLNKLGEDLEDNFLRAQTYAYHKYDTYKTHNEKYFITPLKGKKLSVVQREYVNQLEDQFLSIHEECQNWFIEDLEKWTKWLFDGHYEDKRESVLDEIRSSIEKRHFKSYYLELLRKDIYYVVLNPQERLNFIRRRKTKKLIELKEDYLFKWDKFLEKYLALDEKVKLDDVDELLRDGLLGTSPLQYYGVVKNRHQNKLYPNFEVKENE